VLKVLLFVKIIVEYCYKYPTFVYITITGGTQQQYMGGLFPNDQNKVRYLHHVEQQRKRRACKAAGEREVSDTA
jgi:hypothetical protein